MRSTELVSFCAVVIVAVVCACFGIDSLITLVHGNSVLPLITLAGVVVFWGISIATIVIAWSGWKRPS